MLQKLNIKIRTFLLTAVAIAYPVWDLGFELGAFGEIFFEKLFLAWVTPTAVLLALLLLREKESPISRRGLFVMSVPTIWFLLSLAAMQFPPSSALDITLLGLGLTAYMVCLPYTVYVAISIINPELISLRDARVLVSLVIIAAVIGTGGYLVGRHNYVFLTCHDFKISGNDLPENCRPR
ncbi:MAG: hypothetical protein MJA83_19635 [Gammaproteobacteria bacterium]|nr:hypothetical protein [Gammaproteobacteria bacterium]